MKKAVGAFVVYDICNANSFENLKSHIESIRQNCEPDVVIMVIGNKIDLLEGDDSRKRAVEKEKALEFVREQHAFFGETSAVTNQNVNEMFEKMINEVFNVNANKPKTIEAKKRLSQEIETQKKKGCC